MKRHSLVVGGTRGLGREVVRAFVEAGDTVSVIGRKAPAATDQGTNRVFFWAADVSQATAVLDVLKEILSRNGKLNSLVLLQRYKGEGDKWAGEMETSLTATHQLIEALASQFSDSGDKSIVVVSSIADQFISDTQPDGYHVAKAGLWQLARYYAVKLGPAGIRVNCVAPCTLVKEENKDFYAKNPQLQGLFNKIIPLGRMGTARDSAELISFLCSSRASFLTGQHIAVDGGVSLLSQEALARKLMNV